MPAEDRAGRLQLKYGDKEGPEMTNKELKKLKRSELLEIMIAQSKEIDTLRAQLSAAQKRLRDRELTVAKAGSLAEASLAIFNVLERTQMAADLYLENVKKMAGEGGEKVEE